MARKKEDVARRKRTLDAVREIRGFDREAHFKAGGTLTEWRGIHTVQGDRKRINDKMACRRRIEED